MNPTTQPKSGNPSLLTLQSASPTPLLGKVGAILQEGILVIGVSLFWALILVLAGWFWLASELFLGIETVITQACIGVANQFATL